MNIPEEMWADQAAHTHKKIPKASQNMHMFCLVTHLQQNKFQMLYTLSSMKLSVFWKTPYMPGHSSLHLWQFVGLQSLAAASLALTLNDPALKWENMLLLIPEFFLASCKGLFFFTEYVWTTFLLSLMFFSLVYLKWKFYKIYECQESLDISKNSQYMKSFNNYYTNSSSFPLVNVMTTIFPLQVAYHLTGHYH